MTTSQVVMIKTNEPIELSWPLQTSFIKFNPLKRLANGPREKELLIKICSLIQILSINIDNITTMMWTKTKEY